VDNGARGRRQHGYGDRALSFDANAGRILITDGDGNTRLDTDDGLFHIVDDGITGTLNMAAVTITSSTSSANRNRTDTYNLGSVHADCTHVIGAVRFTGSGTWGIAFSRWTTYMGGTLVWAMTAPGITSGTAGDIFHTPRLGVLYRFYVDSGTLWMERRLMAPSPSGSVTIVILAHDIEYRLKTGLFT
jgi:hypothetical protein